MDKAKGYAGVIFAIAMVAFLFQPFPKYSRAVQSTTISKVDGTVLTNAIALKATNTDIAFVYGVASTLEHCVQYKKTKAEISQCRSMVKPDIHPPTEALNAFDPTYASKLEAMIQNALAPTGINRPNAQNSLEAQYAVGEILIRYAQSKTNQVRWTLYVLHAMVLVIAAFMIAKRRAVGGIVLLPFIWMAGLFRSSAAAAKNIHDRI